MLQALPLGRSTFATLRFCNEIYVDKTALIHQLAQFSSKVFLARPRRFGKSLLVSTFESLFRDGLKYFQGLAIEKLWNDKTYPTVRLDLSEVKEFTTAEEFQKKFHEKLAVVFSAVGFGFDAEGPSVMAQLSSWLAELEPSSLVVLIDEYDAPLTQCLDRAELFDEVRSAMSELFLTLKSNEGCLRFFFMTGITKFSSTSIFSAFNNLQDISMNPAFGTLLGYTEEEMKNSFHGYLLNASDTLGISEGELIERLRDNYDGFSFDSRAQTHVYCPWSVLNFFKYPEMGFENYWYASGGQPSVLKKYLANHALAKPISYAESKEIRLAELNAARQYDDIGLDALLTQAGYYTIREVTEDRYAVLGYPNQEVAVSMAELYADELLNGKRIRFSGSASIHKAMSSGSVETVVAYFNAALNAIDYLRYPVVDEASCRAYLQVLLIGAAMIPKVEIHNALGRSDMEVVVGSEHWVFEFKFARKSTEVPRLLEEAVKQMQAMRYGEAHLSGKNLIRVAAVFDGEERSFSSWKVVD